MVTQSEVLQFIAIGYGFVLFNFVIGFTIATIKKLLYTSVK